MAQVREGEAGQALVVAALSLTVLMLAAGLSIDMGYLRYEKRKMQAAADAAAIAGADELRFSALHFAAAAYAAATANGFSDVSQGGMASVNPQNGPQDGPHTGNNGFVEVVITQNQPTFFMRVFGISSEPVSARAVAGLRPDNACIYALGAGGAESHGITTLDPIEMDLVANNCSVEDNGDLNPLHLSDHFTASSIGDSTGNCTSVGGVSCNPLYISPATQEIVPASDPLANLPQPSPASPCGGGSPVIYTNVGSASSPVSVPSGNYPCGIQILGYAYVSFNGSYVLGSPNGNTGNGSPFASACTSTPYNSCTALLIAGNSNYVTGTDVTFYNQSGSVLICAADSNSTNDGTICGQNGLDWGATPTVDLQAPTSGPYSGVLFYQAPNNAAPATISGSDDNSGNGNNTFLEGVLYFPAASLTVYDLTNDNWKGTPTAWQNTYTILDAYQIILGGKINLGSDYSSLSNPPFTAPFLSE